MDYVFYHTATGCITGVLSCPPEMVADNLAAQGPDIDVVEANGVVARATTHKVVNGEVVEHTFVRPSDKHTWDPTQGGWIDTRDLQTMKADKWQEIKDARTASINADLSTPFGTFQCREEDRQNITDAVMLAQTMAAANQPVDITWTLADNSTVVLGLSQLITVGLLLGQKVQQAHAQARTLRAQITAATSPEEVAAIHFV